ncbi:MULTISPECIES: hypothetical protein [unclassified Sporosarcina]|uniref:hypothetical protein n=1 Tax=unclassified Sporosarcina TaxID=2647733 RepID=UPI0030FA6978
MKKLVIIIAGVIVLLLLPVRMWMAKEDTAMQVTVLDKTVPKGVFQISKTSRVLKNNFYVMDFMAFVFIKGCLNEKRLTIPRAGWPFSTSLIPTVQ